MVRNATQIDRVTHSCKKATHFTLSVPVPHTFDSTSMLIPDSRPPVDDAADRRSAESEKTEKQGPIKNDKTKPFLCMPISYTLVRRRMWRSVLPPNHCLSPSSFPQEAGLVAGCPVVACERRSVLSVLSGTTQGVVSWSHGLRVTRGGGRRLGRAGRLCARDKTRKISQRPPQTKTITRQSPA